MPLVTTENPARFPDFDDVMDDLRVGDAISLSGEHIARLGAEIFQMDAVTFAEQWDQLLEKIKDDLNYLDHNRKLP